MICSNIDYNMSNVDVINFTCRDIKGLILRLVDEEDVEDEVLRKQEKQKKMDGWILFLKLF